MLKGASKPTQAVSEMADDPSPAIEGEDTVDSSASDACRCEGGTARAV